VGVSCHRCPPEVRAECEAAPFGLLTCQDNAARFDAPGYPCATCPGGARGSAVCHAIPPTPAACALIALATVTPREEARA
jgi:hypothetical protein